MLARAFPQVKGWSLEWPVASSGRGHVAGRVRGVLPGPGGGRGPVAPCRDARRAPRR